MEIKGKGKKGKTGAVADGRREDDVKGKGKKGQGKAGDAAEQQREDEAKGKGKHSNIYIQE